MIAENIAGLEKQLREVGKQLTAARKKAAEKLRPLVHGQLADLGMKEAAFEMEFQSLGDVGGKRKGQNAKLQSSGGQAGWRE